MCDWIITAPEELKESDQRRFFQLVNDFITARYGEQNILGAYVHMDETTPHIHEAILPMVDGRLCAKRLITRKELWSFHRDINAYLDANLGYHVSILLDESQEGKKQLSHLNQKQYIAASREIERKEKQLSDVKSEVVRTQTHLAQMQNKVDDLEKKVSSSRASWKRLRAERESKEKQYEKLKSEYRCLKGQYHESNRQRHAWEKFSKTL